MQGCRECHGRCCTAVSTVCGLDRVHGKDCNSTTIPHPPDPVCTTLAFTVNNEAEEAKGVGFVAAEACVTTAVATAIVVV